MPKDINATIYIYIYDKREFILHTQYRNLEEKAPKAQERLNF